MGGMRQPLFSLVMWRARSGVSESTYDLTHSLDRLHRDRVEDELNVDGAGVGPRTQVRQVAVEPLRRAERRFWLGGERWP